MVENATPLIAIARARPTKAKNPALNNRRLTGKMRADNRNMDDYPNLAKCIRACYCTLKNFSYSFVQSSARNIARPSFNVIAPRQTALHTDDSNWSLNFAAH